MHILTTIIGTTLLVLTGLLALAGLLLALVWIVRQLLRLLLTVLVEATSVTSASASAADATVPTTTHAPTSPRHEEEEAAVIRQAATRVLAGEALNAIAQDLTRWGSSSQPDANPHLN